MKKRIMSFALVILIVFNLVALAQAACSWSYSDGKLLFYGKGEMPSYPSSSLCPWYDFRNRYVQIVIENGVTSISANAFHGFSTSSVSIADSVLQIGKGAFYSCENLSKIVIPNSVKSISDEAFRCCYNLKVVDFGTSVTTIGYDAFYLCKALESVDLPSVRSIGNDAFYGCEKLESVTIGDAVTSMGSSAFSGCASLERVSIKGNLSVIKYNTFYACKNLTEIHLPKTLKTIEDYAFLGSGITDVFFAGNSSEWEEISIGKYNTPLEKATLHFGEIIIDVCETENGSISVDKTLVEKGEFVTVTAIPNSGYELYTIRVNGQEISGNTFIAPDKDVIVEAEFRLPQYETSISTVNGAQIRTVGNQGLRFISSIQKSEDFEHVVEYGMVLIPSDDISDISELEIGATFNGHTVAKVPAKAIYDETESAVTFTAVITNIAVKNYTRSYTARAYAIFDNGTIVYSDSGASRSIYQVAERGLQDPYASAENKAVFQAIVDAVSNDDTWGGIY